MALDETLDVIFRHLPNLKDRKDQREIVAVNRKNGHATRLHTPLGLFGQWRGADAYYEIQPEKPVRLRLPRTVIDLFQTGETAEIGVRLRVSIDREQVAAVAKALHDTSRSPTEVIAHTVQESFGRRLEAVGRSNRDALLEQIAQHQDRWQDEVSAEVAQRLNLRCELIIELPPGYGDPIRTVRTRAIEVFPRDTPQQAQTLTLSVLFERTQGPAPEAPPRSEQEWEAWVRQRVQRIYQSNIDLFDHWFEKATVEESLKAGLSSDAKKIGRTIAQLVMEPVARPLVERDSTLQEEVLWTGRWGYPVTFVVRARLKLKKDGAGLYLATGTPNLAEWLKGKVGPIIDSAMFDRDFADLSEAGERALEKEVLAKLDKEAQDIGHTLELLVVVSRLDERRYLQRFEINEPRREFPTKHPRVPAKIEIGLVMQLSDLQAHAQLLVEKRFESEVRAIAVQAVERVMKTIEAEDYFANWEPWPDHPENANGTVVKSKTLRDKLTASIETELNRRFHPTLLEVHLRRVDDDVAELDSQARQIPAISVKPKIPAPDVDNDDEDCQVTVKYRFPGIHSTEVVDIIARGEQRFNMTALGSDLNNWTRACLRKLPADDLLDLNIEQEDDVGPERSERLIDQSKAARTKLRVVERLKQEVGTELKRAYGLKLDIMYVERHLSEKEQLERDIHSQPIRDARARLRAYEGRRSHNLKFLDDDVTQLRQRIREYDNLIAAQIKSSRPDQHQLGILRAERDELDQRLRALLGSNATLLAGEPPRSIAPGPKVAQPESEPIDITPPRTPSAPSDNRDESF